MPKVLRDLQDTSGYWAAVWTICPMPDVHVICDAPIGCFNLVATAVTDYTDAVPHIDNITPSVMREAEVGGTGTGPAVRRTYEGLRDAGMLVGKELVVMSTAESEMIGSDLSDLTPQLQPGAKFFYSDSLSRDEWAGRDIVMQWLWDNFGREKAKGIAVEPGLVNIIGPTYGCFNSPSDLHEVRRLIEGAGGRINMIFPMESKLADIAQLARAQINVVMYKEFGQTLATTLAQPWLHAPMGMHGTNDFVRQLGEYLGTQAQAAAFMQHEKRTTLQAVWDLWRGPQGDWFGTTRWTSRASGCIRRVQKGRFKRRLELSWMASKPSSVMNWGCQLRWRLRAHYAPAIQTMKLCAKSYMPMHPPFFLVQSMNVFISVRQTHVIPLSCLLPSLVQSYAVQ